MVIDNLKNANSAKVTSTVLAQTKSTEGESIILPDSLENYKYVCLALSENGVKKSFSSTIIPVDLFKSLYTGTTYFAFRTTYYWNSTVGTIVVFAAYISDTEVVLKVNRNNENQTAVLWGIK